MPNESPLQAYMFAEGLKVAHNKITFYIFGVLWPYGNIRDSPVICHSLFYPADGDRNWLWLF
jgi:hypothetical protein